MTATVKIQPSGFCVRYPKTSWRVTFVEEASGKFRFSLIGSDFKFEPRDRYRYPTHDDAKRAAVCFLELMKRLARSRMRLSVLAEIGLLKFPQQQHRGYKVWLVVDRARYSWEATRRDGLCIRSQRWYKRPETALSKAQQHIDCEYAKSQIRDVIGWV
ncbi:MAG: hypothetical protein RIB93_05815 [Coleofasciculus sp. D1-CHI-01]|uniref:hypothetical protein n=1 Tax=Coleofasciculus sp. D1-CHI-01 TaxID=3068482 RepID=UPI0033004693